MSAETVNNNNPTVVSADEQIVMDDWSPFSNWGDEDNDDSAAMDSSGELLPISVHKSSASQPSSSVTTTGQLDANNGNSSATNDGNNCVSAETPVDNINNNINVSMSIPDTTITEDVSNEIIDMELDTDFDDDDNGVTDDLEEGEIVDEDGLSDWDLVSNDIKDSSNKTTTTLTTVSNNGNKICKVETCSKLFTDATALLRHYLYVHFICQDCLATYESFTDVAGHRITVHKDNEIGEHKCAECRKYFIDDNHYARHQRLLHPGAQNSKHSSTPTQVSAEPIVSSSNNSKIHGTNNGQHKCDLCDKLFVDDLALNDHKETYHHLLGLELSDWEQESDEHRSTNTSKTNRTQSTESIEGNRAIIDNKKTLINKTTMSYPCDNHKCNKSFAKQTELYEHKRTDHLICTDCDKQFSNIVVLMTHRRSVHKVPYAHKCNHDKCAKDFYSLSQLQRHLINVHSFVGNCTATTTTTTSSNSSSNDNNNINKRKTVYCCKKCDQQFNSEEQLDKHHTDVHQYKCEKCSKLYDNLEQLDKHKYDVHSYKCNKFDQIYDNEETLINKTTMSYPCDNHKCNKSFAKQTELYEHKRTDHLICTDCDKQFSNIIVLMTHRRSVHKVPYAHMCKHDKCGKDFYSLSQLQRHLINVHSFVSSCTASTSSSSNDNNNINKKKAVYCCKKCDQQFNSEEQLDKHHTDVHQYKCEKCSKLYDNLEQLDKHKYDVHSYKCNKCDQIYDNEELLDRHRRITHSHQCDKCDGIYDDEEQLLQHKLDVHSFKCDKCDHNCDSREQLDRHIYVYHNYRCDKCDDVYDSVDQLDKHKHDVHYYKCDKCDQIYDNEELLDRHRRIIHNCKCDKCGHVCDSEEQLHKHRRDYHYYKCDKCHKYYYIAEQLAEHKLQVHSHKCDKCHKLFATVEQLDKHIQDVHWFKCDKCNQMYISKEQLDNHRRDVHWYKCDKCNNLFASEELVHKHRRDVHWHKCDKCYQLFATEEQLVNHRRDVHWFKCDKCDNKYDMEEQLIRHKNDKHLMYNNNSDYNASNGINLNCNGVKRRKMFKCDYSKCNKLFTNDDDLDTHQWTHYKKQITYEEMVDEYINKNNF
ncbi:zinc finger protein 91-like [Oppia nitens]|uniref:zinc finger protein 91-like n=1 Tax=Oppia nitens TaxID=1686743 RepID=UPI0023DC72BD|nr:zinc finger protein 91-like [Oppia nitens]